jgi:hypothetical protein
MKRVNEKLIIVSAFSLPIFIGLYKMGFMRFF